jgi:hypothetical protein
MQIFISYSSADRGIARRVAEVFRARGYQVWIDEGELAPGVPLVSALTAAIGHVDAYVVILTQNSAKSKWVKVELNEAVKRMKEERILVIPIRFDDSPIPKLVVDLVWGDGRTEEGLIHALNQVAAHWGEAVPMEPDKIVKRYEKKVLVSYGIRLVPTEDIKQSILLGPPERKYVTIGDYAEQCGRSLRQIQNNLWFGDAFDQVANANTRWSAVVFEIGAAQRKKLDLLPATWKAVFRILSSHRRLAMIEATEDQRKSLGSRPYDYYAGDQDYWYNQIIHRNPIGIGPAKILPEELLKEQLGIYDLCLDGTGINRYIEEGTGTIPSRIFFVKNTPLASLNVRVQDLGHPNDGVLLV